jgi:DNA-binding NarL/FixJ family response regulator
MIRILIADDHTLMREGLKQILGTADDIVVGGEAGDGFQTLERVRDGEWDLLLLDMSMPGRSGVELIKQIKGEKPKLPILVLSMHKEDEYAVRSIRAGASGYLCKDSAAQQLLRAIRTVAAGGRFISAEVATDLAFNLILLEDQLPHTALSDREYLIFRMIARGEALNDIASRLIRYGLKHGLLDEAALP